MTRDELLALAEKVERAEGPDRELDEAIDRIIRPWPNVGDYDAAENAIWRAGGHAGGMLLVPGDGFARGSMCARSYTASIDAARALVPEGWDWAAGTSGNAKGGHAFLDRNHAWLDGSDDADGAIELDAATPALALTAAALRARARTSGDA